MKRIIKGKQYNTDTAKKCAMRWVGPDLERKGWEELYRKKNGEYFIHIHNYGSEPDMIIPLSYEDARQWAEDHLDADEYEQIFGAVPEDDTNVMTSITMSASDLETIKRSAAKSGMTVSAYIVSKCTDKT